MLLRIGFRLGARLACLAALGLMLAAPAFAQGPGGGPLNSARLLQLARGQVCYYVGRTPYSCRRGTCCHSSRGWQCCTGNRRCTARGCAAPYICSRCGAKLRGDVAVHAGSARGLYTYVQNAISGYYGCRRQASGNCASGDILVRTLRGCNGYANRPASYRFCIGRIVGR